MSEQEFTAEIEVKGADKGAKDFKKVGDAQKGVTDATKKSTAPMKEAAEATKKRAASESDWIESLRGVSPLLGNLADSMLKGSKVAADLSSQNINLGEAFKKVTAAAKGNAGALKLIAAGGAVVLGIMAITHAIQKLREEHERATQAAKKHSEALNELKQQEADRQQGIENIADRRTRIGGMDAGESRKALQLAESIGKQYEALRPENIDKVVAMLGDQGLSRDRMTQAAVLEQLGALQLDPEMTANVMKTVLQDAIRRSGERVAEFLERETAQGQGLGVWGERAQAARIERTASGGSMLAIQAIIKQYAPAGADVERIAELVQKYSTLSALEEFEGRGPGKKRLPGLSKAPGASDVWFPHAAAEVGTVEERAIVREVLNAIQNSAEKMATGAEKMAEAAERIADVPPQVTNNMQNQRIITTGARGRVRNGQNLTERKRLTGNGTRGPATLSRAAFRRHGRWQRNGRMGKRRLGRVGRRMVRPTYTEIR